jgi:hypothetical protein
LRSPHPRGIPLCPRRIDRCIRPTASRRPGHLDGTRPSGPVLSRWDVQGARSSHSRDLEDRLGPPSSSQAGLLERGTAWLHPCLGSRVRSRSEASRTISESMVATAGGRPSARAVAVWCGREWSLHASSVQGDGAGGHPWRYQRCVLRHAGRF